MTMIIIPAVIVAAVGLIAAIILTIASKPVSYTHLDVYKRQPLKM